MALKAPEAKRAKRQHVNNKKKERTMESLYELNHESS